MLGVSQIIHVHALCQILTLSETTNFRIFQSERVCRRQFWIWWKWQKRVENCVGKANCLLQAISPFPAVLSKVLYCRHVITLSQTSPDFYVCAVQAFWKHCRKRRNCPSRAISHFPTMFYVRLENFLPFSFNFKLSSANSISFEVSKICRLGKG